MNCNHPDIELGPELTEFKEFSMSFDPKMTGLTLINSQTIRNAHNSVAKEPVPESEPGQTAKTKVMNNQLCSE